MQRRCRAEPSEMSVTNMVIEEDRSMRARVRVLLLALVAVLILALVQYGQTQASPSSTSVFVFADPQALRHADPARVYDGPSAQTTRATYETLLAYKGTRADEFEPVLATSWESRENGMVWRFKLRRGVKFHDGTPFDANAVKFSFDRLVKMGKGPAWLFSAFLNEKSITVIDPYTVDFRLKRPYGPFLETMASMFGGLIVSPTAVKAHQKGDDFASDWLKYHDAGTGPYTIERVTPNQEVIFTAFKDYWRGWRANSFGKIIIRTVPEPTTRRILLEKGDVLGVNRPSPDDVPALRANPKLRAYIEPELRNLWIILNTKREPLNDKRVRMALSYAFDYNGYATKAMQGMAVPARGPLPATMWGWDPSLPQYSYNLEKARKLLEEARYPSGFRMQIWHLSYDDMRRAAEIFQAGLQQLGINARIQQVTGAALFDMINTGDPAKMVDAFTLYWYPDFADPLTFLYAPFHSSQIGAGGFNGSLYRNAAFDRIMNKAEAEPKREVRIGYYKQAQRMLVDDAVHIWVADLPNSVVLSKDVTGFVFNPYYPNTFNWYSLGRAAR
jgi:peptide/nickel transport system substrate-binding protein